jgi:hypothetical protein
MAGKIKRKKCFAWVFSARGCDQKNTQKLIGKSELNKPLWRQAYVGE